jgi:transcriptional regulator with XRE-family HTH domain
MDRFGEKLSTLRKRRGLSRRELSELVDVSQDHIYSIETGRRSPNSRMVVRIADFFGVTLDQLMRDELDV